MNELNIIELEKQLDQILFRHRVTNSLKFIATVILIAIFSGGVYLMLEMIPEFVRLLINS
jgi:hypothetical protein